jgi:hypothetical protein
MRDGQGRSARQVMFGAVAVSVVSVGFLLLAPTTRATVGHRSLPVVANRTSPMVSGGPDQRLPTGQVPEVPWAAGLPMVAGMAVWIRGRRFRV